MPKKKQICEMLVNFRITKNGSIEIKAKTFIYKSKRLAEKDNQKLYMNSGEIKLKEENISCKV